MRRPLLIAGVGLGGLFAALGMAVLLYLKLGAAQPESYVVVRGDTLFKIANAQGVTVDDLRTWNGLDGDLIEVDQVLMIWPPGARDVEAVAKKTRKTRHAPVSGSLSGTTDSEEAIQLVMPVGKDCLAGPSLDDLDSDEAMAASEGLSHQDIRSSMNAFIDHTLPCLSDAGITPSETLLMEIAVGCNGQVNEVRVLEHGDWPSEVAECVTEVIGYTPFPAHDLPDGEVFTFPLQFTPG